MRLLTGDDEKEAAVYFDLAAQVALEATCKRAKCGSVIVNHGEIIGMGYNSPPGNLESQRRCLEDKVSLHPKVTDKTCCIHAEDRAISDALRRKPSKITSARLYFTRIDEEGQILKSGKPYCTMCSKRALDVGIKEFALWHEEGICVYDTEEYNLLSFQYKE